MKPQSLFTDADLYVSCMLSPSGNDDGYPSIKSGNTNTNTYTNSYTNTYTNTYNNQVIVVFHQI